MKRHTITYKNGTVVIATSKRVVLFNETETINLLPNHLYLNANEVKSVAVEE
jgi:hypothetical protein